MTTIADARTRPLSTTRRRGLNSLPAVTFVVDTVLIALVGLIAIIGRDAMTPFDSDSVSGALGLAGPLILIGWILAVALLGGYQQHVFGTGTEEYKRVARAALVTAAATGIGCYFAQFELSRGFFLLLFVVGIPTMLAGRYAVRQALHRAHRAGRLLKRVVISGSPTHVDEIAGVLRRDTWLGYQVVGALTPTFHHADLTPGGLRVIGHSEHVLAAVQDLSPDVVFFADNALASGTQMRKMAWDLEEHDVQMVVAPSVTDVSRERLRIRPAGGLPLIHVEKPRTIEATRWAKRSFDIAGSLALILAFSPVLLFAALRVRAFDGGPALFRQVRIGRDAKPFECLKFRSMVVDAEARLEALRASSDRADDLLFKMREDPRITAPGRWLRRYSLDELPQLFNVLRGDMSLIGPRPGLPSEAAQYAEDAERRLRVRPGMTGLWQVSGRSELSFDEAIRLDLYYVDNWSIVQDISILARTFGAVFGSRGAY